MKQPSTKLILKWEPGINPATFGPVFDNARQVMPALYSEVVFVQGNCVWDTVGDQAHGHTGVTHLLKADGSSDFLVERDGKLEDLSGRDIDRRVRFLWLRMKDLHLFFCTWFNEENSGILVRPEYILIFRSSPPQAFLIPSPGFSGQELLNLPALVQEHHPGRFIYDPSWSKPAKKSIYKNQPAAQFILQHRGYQASSELDRLFYEAKMVMPDFYDEVSLTIGNCPWEPVAPEESGYMGRTRLTKRDGTSDFLIHRQGCLNFENGGPVDCRLSVFWISLKNCTLEHRANRYEMDGIGILARREFILLFSSDPAQAFVIGAPDLTGHQALSIPKMVMERYPGRFIDYTA